MDCEHDQDGVGGQDRKHTITLLEKVLHCRQRKLIRQAASPLHRGTLNINNVYEWVCTTLFASVNTDTTVQGYYRIFPSEEKR
jgi:hypothetical protein